MKLTVLGCHGPYPADMGATAGYLVETTGGKAVLDMGSGVFARLTRFVSPQTVSAVVLSHRHHDHISDMGVFNYYLEQLVKQGRFTGKIPCYVPAEESEGVFSFREMERAYPYFHLIPIEEGKEYSLCGGCATFYRLRHGAANYGVKVREEGTGRTLAYSGDTNVCPALEKLIEGSDLWLGGAPFLGDEYEERGGHLSVERMKELAKKYGVRALVTHLWPRHGAEEYRAACGEDVEVAAELSSYEV